MKKTTALKILNPILALLFSVQALTGMFHDAVYEYFPDGFFHVVHGRGGFVLVGAVVMHLSLNWAWVKTTLLGRSARTPGK